MARPYADEDFDYPIVEELRRLGHDVLTVREADRGTRMAAGDRATLHRFHEEAQPGVARNHPQAGLGGEGDHGCEN